jgi:alginate O-acetyltransferase complex protein AlgJ
MRNTAWQLATRLTGITLAILTGTATAQSTGFIGKNDWLFYRYEFAKPDDAADTDASLKLLAKFNRQLARNGVALALLLVPSKIRIYADYLPPDSKLDAYTNGKYDAALQRLRAQGVAVVDLNSAFLNSPVRTSDTPLFLRLDTHWAPAGALLAAQTLRTEIDKQPKLVQAWQAAPAVPYQLQWAKQKVNKPERDLIRQLPKGAPEFAMEQVLPFKVSRENASGADLLKEADQVAVTVIGSSYSNSATGYPDAVRYTLQRDLLDISIPVLRGPWVGMENYVQDAAFQRSAPALLVWEIPERELRSPPNYRFREARYISDNQEWLLRASAWVQRECQAAGQAAGNEISKKEIDAQHLRLGFNPPLGPLDYLELSLPTKHARNFHLEAANPSGSTRKWTQAANDDEAGAKLKLAMPLLEHGVSQLTVEANEVASAQQWRVCRLPADLMLNAP